ncbi:D-aminoacyl-tRNA deacylase [Candidatus Neomarinimicrobiota bacterium]
MIAVVQRVKQASINIDNSEIARIQHGIVILLGVMDTDEVSDVQFLSNKITGFRIFNDTEGKMNQSIIDVGGSALVVSQFTLCGDWRKGRRPSFIHAAPPIVGEKLYLDFIQHLRVEGIPVRTGVFGAMMDVQLVNDGPVTFVLDSKLD